MAKFIADLHIHSKYSRATSSQMDVENLDLYARAKGISLMGTGDFTHPDWLSELKNKLQPLGNGLFKYRETHFILTAEVCNNFRKDGQGRRIHNIILAPSFEVVEKINSSLRVYGNLRVDGRPDLALSARDLVKLVLDTYEDCLIIPAHVWTPWFSLFGANSGFDSVDDCFEDQTENIYALETGLSSDPPMNWRLTSLDRFALVSNSDSHSPSRIGREANVFDVELNYKEIIKAIKVKEKNDFLFTIEFFPQEGKYHYDGHRNCNVCLSPHQSRERGKRCPVCGGKLTIGVMHRVEELADRPEDFIPPGAVPCKHLIPLVEILGEALGVGTESMAVKDQYDRLITQLGTEFNILLDLGEEQLRRSAPKRVVEGILKVREGKVDISPGYDGVYGKIKVFTEEAPTAQMSLF